eukprot:470096-Rhodomonas_salina.1
MTLPRCRLVTRLACLTLALDSRSTHPCRVSLLLLSTCACVQPYLSLVIPGDQAQGRSTLAEKTGPNSSTLS